MKYLIVLFLLFGCGSNLTKQGPKRSKSERFYRLDKERGKIYHQRCKSVKKKNRECEKTIYNLDSEWDFFYPDFVLIPYKYIFP